MTETGVLKLPGQIEPASRSLLSAIQEVEEKVGRPIRFFDITTHPNPTVRSARGHHDWDDSNERIWLNPHLSHDDQEAVAAHELAHVLQKAEGYCQTATMRDASGQPILPELNLLGRSINSLVGDVMADRWAIERGFKVVDGLRADALPRALEDARKMNPAEEVALNWNAYYSSMKNLAQIIESGQQIHGPILLGPEIRTQILAIGYANLKLRLSPFDLFPELDALWLNRRPKARTLGIDISALIDSIGVENRDLSKRATIAVLEYLRIPPPLIVVKRPITDEIIWPK